jgi:hypothetical protein
MKGQGSTKHQAFYKAVCFGPLLDNVGEKSTEEHHFRARLKVSAYYYFTFTGLRSKCPGTAGLTVVENSCVNKSELLVPPKPGTV